MYWLLLRLVPFRDLGQLVTIAVVVVGLQMLGVDVIGMVGTAVSDLFDWLLNEALSNWSW